MDLRAGGAARRGGTGSASGADAAAPVAVPRCRRLSPPVEARSDRLMVGTPEGEEGCRALVSLLGAYKVGLTLGEESLGKVKHARRRDTGDRQPRQGALAPRHQLRSPRSGYSGTSSFFTFSEWEHQT